MKKEVIIVIVILAAVYGLVYYLNHKSKYYTYFNKELGFGTDFLDKFTNHELKVIYNYLRDFPRQGKKLTYQENPERYLELIAIDNKHGHFLDLPLS